MIRGRIIWEQRARLVFFLTRREGEPEPLMEPLLQRAGATELRCVDSYVLGTWLGLDCEAQLDVLPYHFVLQIAIGINNYLDIVRADARADAFARAFGAACVRLSAVVAFVCRNLSSAVSAGEVTAEILGQEYRVLAKMTESLLAERFSLLYLDDELARYLPGGTLPNEELPVERGRLLFGGSGAQRLF
jgi:hypothetical protein